ncbi:hypothetical protein GY45DRAFT_786729 [Cubamyces sp. BRFM 1775]|nr:hypothetical protein GY45DRAFT_786729 [Cubamyces sp. BRFM 1775]
MDMYAARKPSPPWWPLRWYARWLIGHERGCRTVCRYRPTARHVHHPLVGVCARMVLCTISKPHIRYLDTLHLQIDACNPFSVAFHLVQSYINRSAQIARVSHFPPSQATAQSHIVLAVSILLTISSLGSGSRQGALAVL